MQRKAGTLWDQEKARKTVEDGEDNFTQSRSKMPTRKFIGEYRNLILKLPK